MGKGYFGPKRGDYCRTANIGRTWGTTWVILRGRDFWREASSKILFESRKTHYRGGGQFRREIIFWKEDVSFC